MEISFANKTVLVTGATGQLGRVMVRTFAKAGGNVAIHYLNNQEMAERLAGEVRALGVGAGIFQADLTDQEGVNRLRDRVEQELGMPEILVANAVIQYQWTEVLEQNPADFESQFRSCTDRKSVV